MHDHYLATRLIVRQVVLHFNGHISFVPKTGLILPPMLIHMLRIGTLQATGKSSTAQNHPTSHDEGFYAYRDSGI
jgi:hypothetical protein